MNVYRKLLVSGITTIMLVFSCSAIAQISFTDVAQDWGLMQSTTFGYMFAYDYDDDSDLDLLMTARYSAPDVMYRNDGNSFTPLHNIGLANSNDAELAIPMDYDHDGDLDIYVGSYHYPSQFFVFEDGIFNEATSGVGLPDDLHLSAYDWVDIDHDGYMDLLLGFREDGWRMFRNLGNVFEEITAETQLPAVSSFARFAVADADLDGDLDIYMTRLSGELRFYVNQGNGVFVDQTISAGLGASIGSGGCAWADFDGDKFPDILTQKYGSHTIYHNNHDLTFTEMNVHGMDVVERGYWWNPRYAVADFDHDGLLDIYAAMCSTEPSEDEPNQLLHLDSLRGLDIWFTNVAPELGVDFDPCSSPHVFDFDDDGDLDLTVRLQGRPTALLRNDVITSNRLQVQVVGENDERDCWHTRLEVCPAGTDNVLFTGETNSTGAWRNGLRHHFPLQADQAYDLHLYFANGEEMHPADFPELAGIVPSDVGHMITVRRGIASGVPETEPLPVITEYALHQNFPNPFNPETSIAFDLIEPAHIRLNVYDLIGRHVATLVDGPRSADHHTVTFNASDLPSGLYFYRLEAGDFTAIRKMVLMK